jgi:hypothetical protein
MFNFEKLDVWQEAFQFADLVYTLTGNFPAEERFGLTNQCDAQRFRFLLISLKEVHAYRVRTSPGS